MFGLLAALCSLPKEREGREALHYENYICTGQGMPATKIYRESSVDKRARKASAAIRYNERIQQQIKLIRLMKKLLIEITHETCSEEIEDMRRKVAQLEVKVEKSARAKDINCEDMFNMDKSDDIDDIELEEIIRNAPLNCRGAENVRSETIHQTTSIRNEKVKQDTKASGDHRDMPVSDTINKSLHDYEDQVLSECIPINFQ